MHPEPGNGQGRASSRSSLAQRIEAISRVSIFATLNRQELAVVAARLIPKRFEAGQILFQEGDPCEGLYILTSGAVKISRLASSGRELILQIERAPSTVAEIPVFDGGPYPATVTAVEPTETLFLAAQDLHQICRQYPEVAIKLLAVVGRRLRVLVSLLHQLTFGSVRRRLAALLLEQMQASCSNCFELPFTHEEIAARLGTVREVISRNLSRFQAQGIIQVDRRHIKILDAEALKHEAELED